MKPGGRCAPVASSLACEGERGLRHVSGACHLSLWDVTLTIIQTYGSGRVGRAEGEDNILRPSLVGPWRNTKC